MLGRTGTGTILLQFVKQEAGQGLKEDKNPVVVHGPNPLKDFFFLTIMTLRISQVSIIISVLVSGYMTCISDKTIREGLKKKCSRVQAPPLPPKSGKKYFFLFDIWCLKSIFVQRIFFLTFPYFFMDPSL